METHALILPLVLAYFAWMLFIGYRSHLANNRSEERENFLIGSRKIGSILVGIGALMGWVDAFTFGYIGALGYDMGWGSFWFIIGDIFGFALLIYFAGAIRQKAAEKGAYMVGNYFSADLSPRCAAVIGTIMALYLFMWMLLQYVVGGQVLAMLTGYPLWAVTCVMGAVTLAYMMLGGFLASIKTDAAQFLIFLVLFIFLPLQLPSPQTWAPALATFKPTPLADVAMLTILAGLSTFASPDIWQRIYSAESPKAARRGIGLMAVGIVIIMALFAIVGMVIKGLHAAPDSTTISQAMFATLIPSWLLPFALVAFMAAIMSTASAMLFASAMSLSSDVALELGLITRSNVEKTCRRIMLVMVPVALALTISKLSIVDLALAMMGSLVLVFPVMLARLLGYRLHEAPVFYSLLVSLVLFIAGIVFKVYTGPAVILPLVVATGTLLLFEGLAKKPGMATKPAVVAKPARRKAR